MQWCTHISLHPALIASPIASSICCSSLQEPLPQTLPMKTPLSAAAPIKSLMPAFMVGVTPNRIQRRGRGEREKEKEKCKKRSGCFSNLHVMVCQLLCFLGRQGPLHNLLHPLDLGLSGQHLRRLCRRCRLWHACKRLRRGCQGGCVSRTSWIKMLNN